MKNLVAILFVFIASCYFSQSTVTVTLNSPGESSWTVPCGVTSITVHAWGGGGAGGSANNPKTAGGGGGGGGYASSTFVVVPFSIISYTIGAGGAITPAASTSSGAAGTATSFSTIVANGGVGGGWGGSGSGSGTSGPGGPGGTGIGTTTVSGSAGGIGDGDASANGGFGGNAGGTGGGAGGASTSNGAGLSGSSPGGGGSGGSQSASGGGLGAFGGAGGNGQITIIYTLPLVVNAGPDQTLSTCTTTNTSLAATTVTLAGYSGSWQCAGCTGISITNTASPSSAVTGNTVTGGFLPGSSTTFIWTVSNGACSYQDEMTVTVPTCAQANPDCFTAQALTVDNSLLCGQTTTITGGSADGCVISGTGGTVWYKFTTPAATTSLVLNVLGTGTSYPHYGVFTGTCATTAAQLACTANVTYSLNSGDPGKHTLLTGLTGNTTYYVEVQAAGAGQNSPFCISVNNVASNSTAPANAQVISSCGLTYNGTTNGGYYPSGGGPGKNNLDGAATQCGACAASADVTFVINDISWFKFCSVNTGTYNVQFDVLSCVFSGVNSGSQMAILTGTDNAMTNIWQATNPTQPATAIQTSPNFSLAAGACAYLIVDGFAGDACTYSYVLSNVAGGCVLLPVELMSFDATASNGVVDISWATASEKDNQFFTVERSVDAVNFDELKRIDGSSSSSSQKNYFVVDNNPIHGISYYRLKQTDFDGRFTYSELRSVDLSEVAKFEINVFPNPVNEDSELNLSVSSVKDDVLNIVFLNSSGDLVTQKEIHLTSSNPLIQIRHKFSKGIYFMKVTNKNGELVTRKIVVK